jgi:glycosyltransferase involved in cell wall biosynthesis
MRILHVYKDYYPVLGGIENHIKMLAEGLIQRGFDVQVLVTNTGPRTTIEEIEGVPVIKAGCPLRISGAPISPSFYAWMRRLKPDITHLHFPNPPGELGQLLLRPSRKFVLTYHSDIVRQKYLLRVYKPFLWKVLARADRIIATSPNYIRSSPYLRHFADKCAVIPLGIDLNPFDNVDNNRVQAIRQRYGSPLLLFVGKLRYYKGLEYLFEALRRIEARLLVVGTGPMEITWRALAEELNLGDKVAFLGEVSDRDLPSHYHACDLFVLPASERSEAFGVVQIEAMACGKPVICTELGTGTSWVNIHGETGLVVPPRDPKALAEAISQLLADEALRIRLGEQGRQRAKGFSQEAMIARVADLYEELCRSGCQPDPNRVVNPTHPIGLATRPKCKPIVNHPDLV